MDVLHQPLKALFCDVRPEDIYRRLLSCKGEQCISRDLLLNNDQYEKIFFRANASLHRRYSDEEISLLKETCKHRCAEETAWHGGADSAISEKNVSVFHLIPTFTKGKLHFRKGEPFCDKSTVLSWREMSFYLGQDILITAHRAMEDVEFDGSTRFFCWPTVIHTNNPIVRETVEKGIAENHSHLNGAAPPFDITWICLMNHPEDVEKIYIDNSEENKLFENFLVHKNVFSASEEVWSITEVVQLAAWLRVLLFSKICGESCTASEDELYNMSQKHEKNNIGGTKGRKDRYSRFQEYEKNDIGRASWLRGEVDSVRMCRGLKVLQPDLSTKNLDYAFVGDTYDSRNGGYFRLFVGERYILYECFRQIYLNAFSGFEEDLFYLYLLLKERLRGEFIQLNGNVGFRNFMKYENRKGALWDWRKEYVNEARRITINGKRDDQNLLSQEERIVPRDSKEKIKKYVNDIDRGVLFQDACVRNEDLREVIMNRGWEADSKLFREKTKDLSNFYVFHFVKRPSDDKDHRPDAMGECRPRNFNVRKDARARALAIADALASYPDLRKRIRGIDACNREIWCRPETFSTEFRFLRHLRISSLGNMGIGGMDLEDYGDHWPELHATYHAGEDFLDIADGLRAIDEAVNFLEMERGDRIGHALALGVQPENHYELKQKRVMTRKQDRLDDIVWLLFRSREFNVRMPRDMREELIDRANLLLDDIYGSAIREMGFAVTLRDYYNAMQLRGDHPDMYTEPDERFGKSRAEKLMSWLGDISYSLHGQYVMNYRSKNLNRDKFPAWEDLKRELKSLMYHYHFNPDVRRKGLQSYSFIVDHDYMKLMRAMQDAMIKELTDKGIYVECNPSSNVLIGTFGKYELHPIFRFNQYHMKEERGNHLCVSLNTDDMGIFDTSLENEYAFVAAALENHRNEEGERRYDDDFISEYLEHLRTMGLRQVFKS